ncbi:signal peptidase I [Kineococcus sp. R8]|nr:signal peptidase I [Kineococcus siccus]
MQTVTQPDAAAAAAALVGSLIGGLIGYLLATIPLYGVLKKAAHPDVPAWGAFVPVYNTYCLLKVVGRPWWFLLLLLVPLVNIVVLVVVYHDLSRSFGHGAGFTVGLVLLSFVFLFVLWLGSSRYLGPAAAPATPRYA